MNVDRDELINDVENSATNMLSQMAKTNPQIPEEFFRKAVRGAADSAMAIYNISLEEIPLDLIAKKLQQRFNIKMTLGTMFTNADKYKPWLEQLSGEIDWYYWNRYKNLLINEKFPLHVVRSLDGITDQILDHTENPKKEGSWDRRGMVVGHVQSGKTANYTGLICKAADTGYQVIIVMAGMLNSLRNQTQERVDQGFIGKCTRLKTLIGSGLLDNSKIPAYFTTSTDDFSKNIANQIGVQIGDLKEPVILVIKKNPSTLKNLISWLKDNNPHKLNEFPVLLIDDEADHASINYKEGDITTINARIRELLGLFDQSSYVGYTATPFANIFIDPDSEDEMYGDDLFPRDFILSLDPPDNYIGPEKIFSQTADLEIVRRIDDYEDLFPLKHKKDWKPDILPFSLYQAIQSFVITRAIRLLRGQVGQHNSMMINVSRFTDVQSHIKGLVNEFLKETLKPAINNHCMLSKKESLKNAVMQNLKDLWENEYDSNEFSWVEIQKKLGESVSSIGVIEVNSSANSEPLDYSRENYPNGRNVIAIGGMSLSRGLTLEGLVVSYFLRNSIMYDTLLQMGRWFGYRDGFADICRIYMSFEAAGWYSHISTVIEELRDEFKRMKMAKLTPNEFGLCVRAHPESLIVTARNKMRTGKMIPRQIGLEGRLIETKTLSRSVVEHNFSAFKQILNYLMINGKREYQNTGCNKFWTGVNHLYVSSFIEGVINDPESDLTEKRPLLEYIQWLSENGYSKWDVVICSVRDGKSKLESFKYDDLEIKYQYRTVDVNDRRIKFPNRRVATLGTEKTGLNDLQIDRAVEESTGKSISDSLYRKERNKPLLMLHLLDCHDVKNSDKPLFENGIIAWGLSFPGEAGKGRPKKLVQYMVNTRYWEQEYGQEIEYSDEVGVNYE